MENKDVVWSVSALNSAARDLLETSFYSIWIEGELSSFTRPSSGHWYFTLKDAHAQIRCAMFKNRNQFVKFSPAEGAQVLIQATVSLYDVRGDYQLIVEQMQAQGDGLLKLRFEALKQKLLKEGLFDPKYKKQLPLLPKTIGVVTSPTGAAIRDILSVLKRRFPLVAVIIYPTPVQGQDATNKIVGAIEDADRRKECDVLIIARGGGSIEDLWCFNEETVARALFNCAIPSISAIGHEIDFTITDFVADVRAPTPSAAAEICIPHQHIWYDALTQYREQLINLIQQTCAYYHDQLHHLHKRLRHPREKLISYTQSLDYLEQALKRAMMSLFKEKLMQLHLLQVKLEQTNPMQMIQREKLLLTQKYDQLHYLINKALEKYKHQFALYCKQLHTLSPLDVLARGYSTTKTEKGQLVLSTKQLQLGQKILTKLAFGSVVSQIIDLDNSF